MSYSCMRNMDQIINSHNQQVLNKTNDANKATKPCNCKTIECPMKGQSTSCRTESVVYQATVETESDKKTYIGLTGNEFKTRYYQHRHDFSNPNNKDKTELSKYIWSLKENKTKYEINWKIIKKVPKRKNGNKICRLCISEALEIIKNKRGQLNKKTEIMNSCRYKNKF